MLIEKIKEICDSQNLDFTYGKDHWQNLTDTPSDDHLPFEERLKFLKLLWKDSSHTFDKYGTVTKTTFTGDFLMLVRSKISDKNHEYKYQTHIKNLEKLCEDFMLGFNICERFVLKNWRQTEVTDVYDNNMDGLKISFTIDFE